MTKPTKDNSNSEAVLLRTERSMIPPVGHPRRAKYEQCVREAGKVLADAYDTGKVRFQEQDLRK